MTDSIADILRQHGIVAADDLPVASPVTELRDAWRLYANTPMDPVLHHDSQGRRTSTLSSMTGYLSAQKPRHQGPEEKPTP